MVDFKYDIEMKYAVATMNPYPKNKGDEEPYTVVALFTNLDDAVKYLKEENCDWHYRIWEVFDGKIEFVLKSEETADEYSPSEPPVMNYPKKEA